MYTIREDTVSGYTTHITGSQTQGFAITNTHHPENEEVWFSKQDLKVRRSQVPPCASPVR